MDQTAPFRLSVQQVRYLRGLIATDSSFAELVRSLPNIRLEQDCIALDRTDAAMLSDYCSDRLAAAGFDVSYEPNDEGAMLESLIDALFPLIAR